MAEAAVAREAGVEAVRAVASWADYPADYPAEKGGVVA